VNVRAGYLPQHVQGRCAAYSGLASEMIEPYTLSTNVLRRLFRSVGTSCVEGRHKVYSLCMFKPAYWHCKSHSPLRLKAGRHLLAITAGVDGSERNRFVYGV
jgi:hypothetical protein